MMSKVKLVWATPEGEELIAYMARVSNPNNQENKATAPNLLRYLMKNKHWSPFEMVNVCMEIEVTRDIGRQILRHRSFSFQEFSQRYAEALGTEFGEARMQDEKNRQNSIETEDYILSTDWLHSQMRVAHNCKKEYDMAIKKGIAKEVARKILPEGLTTSRMYMNGTLRSWMHYVEIRCDEATQKEHREVAVECRNVLAKEFPSLFKESL
jgi:thymidylate synthase (FAD)